MATWNSSLETGVPLMDTQHQELFRHMDDLADKSKADRIPQIIDYLGKYVDKHFREEQNLHASCGYPQREEHKKLHADFVESYKQLKSEFDKAPGKAGLMSMRINRTAVEWLKNHIFGPDRMFAKYYFSLPGNKNPKEAASGLKKSPTGTAPATAAKTPAGTASGTKKFSFSSSALHADSTAKTRDENVCDSDWEVIKRVPARALADELVRRSDAAARAAAK